MEEAIDTHHGVDDAQYNNDNITMSDLLVRDVVRSLPSLKLDREALATTSGSLHSARSFPITRRHRRSFPSSEPIP